MEDTNNEDQKQKDRWPVDFSGLIDPAPTSLPRFTDLQEEVRSVLHGTQPNPDKIKAALSDNSIPVLEDAGLTVSTISDTTFLSPDEVDRVVKSGGDAISFSVEAGEDTASVLLDAGDEAIEVVVESGSEEAAEAVAELLAATLE
jgi:hypothetical protein